MALESRNDFAQQLFVAAVADFASMLKQSGFPNTMRMENGQEIRDGIPLPIISWSVFHGNITQALNHIRTQGLPIEGEKLADQFLSESWRELRYSS